MFGPIDEVAIAAADFKDTIDFYERLGCEIDRLNESEGFVKPSPDSIHVYIFETEKDGVQERTPEVRSNPVGLDHISVNVEDVDEIYDDLTAKGIAFVKEPTTYSEQDIRLATVQDPNGTLIYFVSNV